MVALMEGWGVGGGEGGEGGQAGTPFHLKLLLGEQSLCLGLDHKSVNIVCAPIAGNTVGRWKRLHYGSPAVVVALIVKACQL